MAVIGTGRVTDAALRRLASFAPLRHFRFGDRLQWSRWIRQLLQPLVPIKQRVKITSERATWCSAEHRRKLAGVRRWGRVVPIPD